MVECSLGWGKVPGSNPGESIRNNYKENIHKDNRMRKKRKKAKEENKEKVLEIEQEINELDSDSINQFEKEEKQIISRYIG